jgi:hypothetical protein
MHFISSFVGHNLYDFKTLFYLSKNISQYLQVVVFMGYHTAQYLRIPTFRKKHAATIFTLRLVYVNRKYGQAAGEEATVDLG